MKPLFITFEGPEGSGKTTQIQRLSQKLLDLNHKNIITREPGGTEFGCQLRQLLLHGDSVPPFAELMLFLADRADHVTNFIKKHLGDGKIVLCDRYADSTICYQGYGRGLDVEFLRRLNVMATDHLQPDLTLLLDLPVKEGLSRLHHETMDRIDSEDFSFHQKVREGFLKEAEMEPNRFRLINAGETQDAVTEQIWNAVTPFLKGRDI